VIYGRCNMWIRLGAFENWVLRRIFGPKGGEVTGEWRKLHNGELHNLFSSPNNIRKIKTRRMRWAGHVARMGTEKMRTSFRWKSPKEGDHSQDQGVDGRTGLECTLGRLVGVCAVDSAG
jgi:hypothetical protein